MKIDFPIYKNYRLTNDVTTREIKESNNFNSVDDFTKYINKVGNPTLEECHKYKADILKSMETNKICPFLYDDLKEFKKEKANILKMYPIENIQLRDHWGKQFDLLADEYKKQVIRNTKFIHQNKDDIFAILDEVKLAKIAEQKDKKKLANKKYYEKMKEIMQTETSKQIPLTEEQRKERKQLANKKYYEKKVREKPEKPEKITLTDEEKRERRKEANKRYYEKQKAKAETIVVGSD